ncbi:MAG: hypothetical protein JW940_21100 [Polyangiaceae bacterium]|nr:hypothetical protein [Polyangiaceae bacterium]
MESDRVERKESAADGDKLRQAVCAFANDIPNHQRPGILFVEARDDGSPSGIEVSDRLLQILSSMASDGNIQPFPAMTVSKRKLNGHDMATHAPVRIYWFGDRVEIHSPGGPFGQVTRENFGTPGICDYRNPHLAGVMKDLGFVQRFGMGIATALGEMAKNGNPKPELQVSDAHVAVILRGRP